MNVFGVLPNLSEVSNVKLPGKSSATTTNYTGPSFGENLREVARSAKMQITNGNSATLLELSRQKEEFDKLFDFAKAEEEFAEEYIARIQKLFEPKK